MAITSRKDTDVATDKDSPKIDDGKTDATSPKSERKTEYVVAVLNAGSVHVLRTLDDESAAHEDAASEGGFVMAVTRKGDS